MVLVVGAFGFLFFLLFSREPIDLPQVPTKRTDYYEVKTRVDTFEEALDSNQSVELVLTTRDVNTFLQFDPEAAEIKDFIRARFEDGSIKGRVSFPADQYEVLRDWIPKGVFLNGDATFLATIRSGLPFIYLQELEVNGRSLPERILKELRKENMLKPFLRDSRRKQRFRKINYFKIKGDVLVIRSVQ